MNALDRETDGDDNEDVLVLEQHFAIVPEWVLDADISDAALRLYAVLLRYGQSSGHRMPGRRLLASRLHKRSRDSVDRALKELVGIGAIVVQHRRHGAVNLTNRYVVRSTPPQPAAVTRVVREPDAASESATGAALRAESSEPAAVSRGGRKSAATPGRTDAATLAANLRPNPEVLTQRKPPPPRPPRGTGRSRAPAEEELRQLLAVDDVVRVAAECRAAGRR